MSFHVLFVFKYVLYYCHQISNQLQLTNIYYLSKHISGSSVQDTLIIFMEYQVALACSLPLVLS